MIHIAINGFGRIGRHAFKVALGKKNVKVVASFEKVKLVEPILGQNFSGDQFFSDGKAYLISF